MYVTTARVRPNTAALFIPSAVGTMAATPCSAESIEIRRKRAYDNVRIGTARTQWNVDSHNRKVRCARRRAAAPENRARGGETTRDPDNVNGSAMGGDQTGHHLTDVFPSTIYRLARTERNVIFVGGVKTGESAATAYRLYLTAAVRVQTWRSKEKIIYESLKSNRIILS